ncbi:MAG: hypothetical protein FJ387_08140 [Verrucomicrobia bacterium]|nr:hypothetical protein [Verrucomicrobiota bacterium]
MNTPKTIGAAGLSGCKAGERSSAGSLALRFHNLAALPRPRGRVRALALAAALWTVALLSLPTVAAASPPAQWVRIPTDPASTPRARHNHAMVFDEVREVIVMHDGRLQDGTVLSATWQWDGQRWTQLATDGPRVFQHSMAYDPSRGVTVLYGGRTAAGHANPIGDTWEWDGQSWTRIEVGPTKPPPPVMGGMAYDPIRKKVVRQGGITAPNDTFDVGKTWEWEGQTWTQIADGFIRGAHSLLFDAVRGRMLAFGGSSTGNNSPSPGLWEFDGDQWTLLTAAGPSARFPFNRALVWDAHRNVGVLYGGAAGSGEGLDDTWEWDGVGWQQVNVPGPGRRGMHAMA